MINCGIVIHFEVLPWVMRGTTVALLVSFYSQKRPVNRGFFVTMGSSARRDSNPGSHQSIQVAAWPSGFLKAALARRSADGLSDQNRNPGPSRRPLSCSPAQLS